MHIASSLTPQNPHSFLLIVYPNSKLTLFLLHSPTLTPLAPPSSAYPYLHSPHVFFFFTPTLTLPSLTLQSHPAVTLNKPLPLTGVTRCRSHWQTIIFSHFLPHVASKDFTETNWFPLNTLTRTHDLHCMPYHRCDVAPYLQYANICSCVRPNCFDVFDFTPISRILSYRSFWTREWVHRFVISVFRVRN